VTTDRFLSFHHSYIKPVTFDRIYRHVDSRMRRESATTVPNPMTDCPPPTLDLGLIPPGNAIFFRFTASQPSTELRAVERSVSEQDL
jgi:hypothetical protein